MEMLNGLPIHLFVMLDLDHEEFDLRAKFLQLLPMVLRVRHI